MKKSLKLTINLENYSKKMQNDIDSIFREAVNRVLE